MNPIDNRSIPDRVLITGGTGFIGTALSYRLLEAGSQVSVLTRNTEKARRHFSGKVDAVDSLDSIEPAKAPRVIVNLAGKNLGEERWNPQVKQQLIDSRVNTTRQVIDYIAQAEKRPELLINGSAVGYYGARGDEPMVEEEPPADEFQSELCQQWEQTAMQAEQYGVRVCISRTGVVMGPGGGALSGLLPMFRKGLGAVVASGDQWISWIHMQDLVAIFLRFMSEPSMSGAYNNTSPRPVTNREFARTIGKVLNRPVFLRMPAWSMYLLYGEFAHLYVTGQKVIPKRHIEDGFEYRYPDIESALRQAVQ